MSLSIANLADLTILSWLPQKIGKSIGILYKVRYILNELSSLQLNWSLIEPYLNYCCLIWCNNKMNVHLNRLHKLQKKNARFKITFSDFIAHSQPLMDWLNVLNIYDLFKLQLYTFMYKYFQGLLSKSLNMSLDLRLIVHTYNTGHCNK